MKPACTQRIKIERDETPKSSETKKGVPMQSENKKPQDELEEDETEIEDQDPGEQQKRNQGDEAEDPLAA
jgi:hypothetical protein